MSEPMSLLKRDGRTVPFNVKKIEVALNQANAEEEQNKINALTENVNKMIIGKDKVDELTKACDDAGVPIETLLQRYDKDSLEEMTFLDYRKAMAALSKLTA